MDFTIIISDRQPKRKVEISVSRLALETGYDKSHISRVFSGNTTPSLECTNKIAGVLGVTMDELTEALLRKKKRKKKEKRKSQRVIYAGPKIS